MKAQPVATPEFDSLWKDTKEELAELRERMADNAAKALLLEFARELAPYKLKPGRAIKINFGMGSLAIELPFKHKRYSDSTIGTGGTGWGGYHDFPIQVTLRGILKRLEALHNDEDVCILSSLDGKHIPLS